MKLISSSISPFLIPICLASAIQKRFIDTPTLKSHNFNDNTMGPWVECSTLDPSYVKVTAGGAYSGGYKLTASFNEDYYDGQRDRKSAEFCASNTNTLQVHKEGWQGFAIYIPRANYFTDSQAIIAQQFCPGYCNSWCGTISLINTEIVVDHRGTCGTPTTTTVVQAIPFDTWHSFIVNIRYSNIGDGHYKLWHDENLVYNVENIDLGFDDGWTTNGSMIRGAGWKNGMYNADISRYQNRTKELYFDNVSWYNVDDGASDGYSVVNPVGSG